MAVFTGITEILHPMTVHFPIALILVSCFLAVIYWFKNQDPFMNTCIKILVFLGAVGSWAAVITGSYHLPLSAEGETIKHIHHNFATATAWVISFSAALYVLFYFYKKPLPKWLGWVAFLLLIAATVLISLTGYYGGYIVYNVLL
ncbi:MAG: DUF2231 domain-containing protein [Bacteroidales bacterium]